MGTLKPAKLIPFLGVLLFGLALWVLHRELKTVHYIDVVREIRALPPFRVVLALALAALGYLALTGYDATGVRYIRHALPYSRTAMVSFISYAVSHNVGGSFVSGGSVRMRLYSLWGFSTVEITKVVAFCVLTFWVGLFSVGGVYLLLGPLLLPPGFPVSPVVLRILGAVFLAVVAAYLVACAFRRTPFRVKDWEISLPSLRLAMAQVIVSSLDWVLSAGVLYVLLPPGGDLSFPEFLCPYLIAQVAGLVSHVPGGLGVFETVLLLLLSPRVGRDSLVGAMLVFRVVYYLLPLALAAMAIGVHETVQRKEAVLRAARVSGAWSSRITPTVLAITTFAGGVILLFSGAIPAESSRLAWLADILPLPVMEMSHFLGSLVGVGLLFLAGGIQQRLDSAYFLSAGLLSTGIILSLSKGLDYEEAVFLSVMLLVLLPCRRHFFRKSSLVSERFTPEWTAIIFLTLLGTAWLGVFSYKHVEYSQELWWKFVLHGGASRFLRATAGASAAALIFSLAKLLHPAHRSPEIPGEEELEKAFGIARKSRYTNANLGLLGDKTLLFSESGNSFLMYGVQGRSWVALGDPVGPLEEHSELAWRFQEMCDRHDGWTVFYEVRADNLPLYLDLGLTPLKLGEEARVRLETFSLEGSARKELRQVDRRLKKEGAAFEVVPANDVGPLLPELKEVSDAWLNEKKTREKGFSIGYFDEGYLRRFPLGVVRKEGRIVAFANILEGYGNEEISVDLMRYLPGSPHGTMDYLFLQLMLWGKEEGYRWFNLGMAPLSGMGEQELAPLWNQVGAFLFRHGEQFYNFRGVRQYKEKFDPAWEPKYLASPAGIAFPRILASIGILVSRGIKGVVGK
ncbi:MAG: bifunctional lysylphosphatidylglycerol flippase/synthetase MprF [Candidatus Deferrimicrobiaceae bacterium]